MGGTVPAHLKQFTGVRFHPFGHSFHKYLLSVGLSCAGHCREQEREKALPFGSDVLKEGREALTRNSKTRLGGPRLEQVGEQEAGGGMGRGGHTGSLSGGHLGCSQCREALLDVQGESGRGRGVAGAEALCGTRFVCPRMSKAV